MLSTCTVQFVYFIIIICVEWLVFTNTVTFIIIVPENLTHAPSDIHTHLTCSQKVNEKPQVVNDYESGRAIPNQQIISKLERAVGSRLRGKDIGKPLGGPRK